MTIDHVCCGHFNTVADFLRGPPEFLPIEITSYNLQAPETLFYNPKAATWEGNQKDTEHNR